VMVTRGGRRGERALGGGQTAPEDALRHQPKGGENVLAGDLPKRL